MRHRLSFLAVPLVALAACVDQPTEPHLASEPITPLSGRGTTTIQATVLGTLGGNWSIANAINARGDVVGHSELSSGDRGGFVLNRGSSRLQNLPGIGGWDTQALGINNSGQIVGYGLDETDFMMRAILWDSESDGPLDLGTFGGVDGQARDINNRGDIVGWALDKDDSLLPFFRDATTGQMIEIGPLEAPSGVANAINSRGQVVGYAVLGGMGIHPFVWDRKSRTIQDLGTLGEERFGFSAALDINDRGQVVGISMLNSGDLHPFLWDPADGVLRDLGTLGGATGGATAINNSGQIVGWSSTASGEIHAFLWDPRTETMYDLGTAGETSRAYDISDRGVIVGEITSAGGETRGVIWDFSQGNLPAQRGARSGGNSSLERDESVRHDPPALQRALEAAVRGLRETPGHRAVQRLEAVIHQTEH